MKVVIVGCFNVGKLSLLNVLVGCEVVIVIDIVGIMCDVLCEYIYIDGMLLYIIDIVGLCEVSDEVECIGIECVWQEIEQVDCVLFMVDGIIIDVVDLAEIWLEFIVCLLVKLLIIVVCNKVDIIGEMLGMSEVNGYVLICFLVRIGEGVDVLCNYFKQSMGFDINMEGGFLVCCCYLQVLEQVVEYL